MRRGWEYFARSVASPEDLPEAVRAALLRQVPAARVGLLAIIPPQEFPVSRTRWLQNSWVDWRWTPHRTLAFCDDAIILIEGVRPESLQVAHIPLPALLEMRLTSVLLYSCLDLFWLAGASIEHRRLEFNAVGRSMIERGLALARSALSAHSPYPPLRDDQAVPFRERFPLKFANMTRLSLLPDEAVQWALHAPPLHRGGARRWQTLAPGRALLLTPQHLIVIEEGAPHLFDAYRIVQQFFPRGQVRCVRRETEAGAPVIAVETGAAPISHTLRLPLPTDQADALYAALTGWIAAPFRIPLAGQQARPRADARSAVT